MVRKAGLKDKETKARWNRTASLQRGKTSESTSREARQTTAGDTLVEVILSIAILSLVLVGGSTLMSLGMRNAITSVEHTQVRNGIVGQSELLHYLRNNSKPNGTDQISQTWNQTVLRSPYLRNTEPSPIDSCTPSGSRQPFYLTAEYESASRPPRIRVENYTGNASSSLPYSVPGKGLWIEAVSSPPGATPAYADFHIRACWLAAGSGGEQLSNTVVRLYTQD